VGHFSPYGGTVRTIGVGSFDSSIRSVFWYWCRNVRTLPTHVNSAEVSQCRSAPGPKSPVTICMPPSVFTLISRNEITKHFQADLMFYRILHYVRVWKLWWPSNDHRGLDVLEYAWTARIWWPWRCFCKSSIIFYLLFYYFATSRGAEYCVEYISVCLSVWAYLCHHTSSPLQIFMPPPFSLGGIMFSGYLSICVYMCFGRGTPDWLAIYF